MLLLLPIPAAPAQQGPARQDIVIYATGRDGHGRGTLRGTVVDFTGESLVLETGAGRSQTIPAARVIDVQTSQTPDQTAADRLFEAGRYQEAAGRYLAALRAERRGWVQRQIMASCVRCFFEQGQFDRAAKGFLSLVQNDPRTQYFDAIPLLWWPHQPSPVLRELAQAWLEDGQNSVARLLGASWLLSTDARAAATAALGELIGHSDARIALLAEAQLWRTRVVTAKPADVDRWQATIARMPERLRAGPYFVVGQARAALGQNEPAALALLRVPILYPEHSRLAAAALLSAGRELERIGRRHQAATLYREAVRDHAGTPAAAEAASRLKGISSSAGE